MNNDNDVNIFLIMISFLAIAMYVMMFNKAEEVVHNYNILKQFVDTYEGMPNGKN